ncbi:hypothetical protein APHAL10511_003778 [Amanita phalloides]|nr:hypothetical protein APHAL10511_003778 [Amanita phalloides]
MSWTPESIILLQQEDIISRIIVGSLSLLAYDFFQTLELEVEYIWKSRYSLFTLNYLVMKYLPMIDVQLLVILNHAKMKGNTCNAINLFVGCSFVVGVMATQLILTLRTWVLWGRSRWLACVIILFATCWFIYVVIFCTSSLKSIHFTDRIPSGSCIPLTGSQYSNVWVSWMSQLIYDAFLCILLIVRVVIEWRNRLSSRSIFFWYREGILYYIYIFLLTLICIGWIKNLGEQFPVPAIVLTRVFHPMLTTRIVLHARRQANHTLDDTDVISTAIEV